MMLLRLIKDIAKGFLAKAPSDDRQQTVADLVQEAVVLATAGDKHGAVRLFREALKIEPFNVELLNDLGSFLIDLNQEDEAAEVLRRATVLDDTFAPALVNYALLLNTHFQSKPAEELLERARRHAPGVPHIDAILGGVKMTRGRPTEAISDYLSAWLKDFDNSKFAHNYLFNRGYSEIADAESIVAEHMFWARTLPSRYYQAPPVTASEPIFQRKIRVGYLSPDFRQHSVRYFIRPLIENHDHSRFEVYGYSDMEWEDIQTDKIKQHCDVFRKIANLPDDKVREIMRDDKLDILVELAGHTSSSRLSMLASKVAPIQMSGLGYPPTTGLSSIDYKLVDRHTSPEGSDHLYSERPLRLPQSFWCFNPLEDTPEVAPSPCLSNGYVTFGCFGNVAKISPQILSCWVEILESLPSSRLLLKSLTFQDADALSDIQTRFEMLGVDAQRLRFDKPDTPDRLFQAYADVDIVLDTFPFNGGTTTCFAVWMGVPFVTLAGEALISRMGLSMAKVLRLDDCIAFDEAGYVVAALRLADDHQKLAELRQQIRGRMLETSLGNGEIYARHVEAGYLQAMNVDAATDHRASTRHPVLPEQELSKRAEFVMAMSNLDGAAHIIDYLFSNYPRSTHGYILSANLREMVGDLGQARQVLLDAVAANACDDITAILINVMRYGIMLGEYDSVIDSARLIDPERLDPIGANYIDIYLAAANLWRRSLDAEGQAGKAPMPSAEVPKIVLLSSVREETLRSAWMERLQSYISVGVLEVRHLADDVSRTEQYASLTLDEDIEIVMLVSDNVDSICPDLIGTVVRGLHDCDVIGAAGADRLLGAQWFSAGFDNIRGALVVPSSGKAATSYDLCVYGDVHGTSRHEIKVLEASFLAIRRRAWGGLDFDAKLEGPPGLIEQDWSYRMACAGYRLGVVPELGIVRTQMADINRPVWRNSLTHYMAKHQLSQDVSVAPSAAGIPLPLPTLASAWPVLRHLNARR